MADFFWTSVLCIVLNVWFDGIGAACDSVQTLEISTHDEELDALLGMEWQDVELLMEKE